MILTLFQIILICFYFFPQLNFFTYIIFAFYCHIFIDFINFVKKEEINLDIWIYS